jgi:hypothetical protein
MMMMMMVVMVMAIKKEKQVLGYELSNTKREV